MFKLWLLIAAAFVPQEVALVATALLEARRHGIGLTSLLALWLLLTAADILAGYRIGLWLKGRTRQTRFDKSVGRTAARIEARIGGPAEIAVLLLLGFINLPYVNAFLYGWLGISRKRIFWTTLAGNAVTFLFEWYAAITAGTATRNLVLTVILTVAAVTGIGYVARSTMERVDKKR